MNTIYTSKTKWLAVGLVGVGVAAVLFAGAFAQVANAQSMTLKDLVELFISLGIISPDKAAQARTAVSSPSTGAAAGTTFARNLTVGSTGSDVKDLQKFLNSNGYVVSSSGPGSVGSESTYFGPATRAALAKYQAAKGISPAVGYFGPTTMKSVNAAGGTTTTTTTTGGTTTTVVVPSGSGLVVSSPAQPASGLAPENAARVPFTKFTLTAGAGDVAVNNLTIEHSALAGDAVFSGVILLGEDGTQIGVSKTFNSNHQATLGEAFTVKAGTSKTYTIAGNMAANNDARAGEISSLKLLAVNTSAAVSGSLPIVGAAHTINSTLALGSVTNQRGSLDPNAAASKNVGVTGYTFSAIQVTDGSQEDIRIHSIRWNQASSVGASDLANIVTVVDGTAYPTTVSADGKYYTSTFGSGIVIAKGLNKELSVKGDIIGGSGRTVAFNVEKTTDIYITGETYKYGITPPTSGTGFTSGTIWYAGKTVTVDTGSLTVQNATSVAAQNVAVTLASQPLGGFSVEVKGEPITVASSAFTFTTTGTATAGGNAQITNVTLVDENGTVVAGPADVGHTGTLTLGDTILYGVGKKVYTLKGKVGSGFGSDGTVAVAFTPSTAWTTVTGQVTGKTISTSSMTSTSVALSTMTVKVAALAISVSSSPSAQSIVAGAQQFTFANIQLSAISSGEDVTLNAIPVDYELGAGTVNVTSCSIYNGSAQLTTGTNTKDGAGDDNSLNFTFDSTLTIPKGTVVTLAVKCNIPTSVANNDTWSFGYNDTSSPTANGKVSGSSVTVTESTAAGQLITAKTAGSLTVELSADSPAYSLAAAGTINYTASVLRIRATNEAVRINDIALQLINTASSSISDLKGGKITLWDGANKVGEATFVTGAYYNTASTTVSTCAGCSELIVPKDDYKDVTVKVDLDAQGTSQPGTPGAFLSVDYEQSRGSFGGVQGTGSQSGTKTLGSSADTASSGFRVLKTVPTVKQIALPTGTSLSGASDKPIYRFSVAASPGGNGIGINKFTFRFST
ncbi:MAG: peptidoglycan-binding domain-containing protein, partial [bacterium]|nr:peptidoglycan-binding domain-containing protein [bacterium]